MELIALINPKWDYKEEELRGVHYIGVFVNGDSELLMWIYITEENKEATKDIPVYGHINRIKSVDLEIFAKGIRVKLEK